MMGVILELRLLHYSLSPTSASDHFRIWTNVNFKIALNVEEVYSALNLERFAGLDLQTYVTFNL